MRLLILILAFGIFHCSGQTILFSENFDSTTISTTQSGTPGWTLDTLYVSSPNGYLGRFNFNDSAILQTPSFDATSSPFVLLEFDHICKVSFFDRCMVQVSIDGGITWTTVSFNYCLTQPAGLHINDSFSCFDYVAWNPANNTTPPNNTWWRHEQFDISAIAQGQPDVRVRFLMCDYPIADGMQGNYGWLIDNATVLGRNCENINPVAENYGNVQSGTVYNTDSLYLQFHVTDNYDVDTTNCDLYYSVTHAGVTTNYIYSLHCDSASSGEAFFDITLPPLVVNDTACYYMIAHDNCGNGDTTTAVCIYPVAPAWKTYPYHQDSTYIYFPQDEGRHPNESIEWWYTNGSLIGDSTGTHYTYMLTYFYTPALGFDGFRILNIANETNGQFYPQTLPCNYPVLSQSYLDINASVFSSVAEHWTTSQDSMGNHIPFEYNIYAQSASGSLDLSYVTLKRPLVICDSGYFFIGASSYTYYYSQTGIAVDGIITLNGVTEHATGTAWIDRQYGSFNPNVDEKYEWFSLQLSNGMDLNVWNLFTPQSEIPDTSTFRFFSVYVNDSTSASSDDFTLDRQSFFFMPGSTQCYSNQWHFVHDSIDITISAMQNNQEVVLPFRFYEGSVSITGTVGGIPVTGHGFAELLHKYEHPTVQIASPSNGQSWDGSQPVTWQLINPDDARNIYYDIEVSLNDSLHYNYITQQLTDTFYLWNTSSILPGTPCWLKVTAYSVDTTLTGNDIVTPNIVTGINEIYSQQVKTTVYPDPFTSNATIVLSNELSGADLRIYNDKGEQVREMKNIVGKQVTISRDGLSHGTYLYEFIFQGKLKSSGKFIVY